MHLDTLDLCQAKARAALIKATASELYLEEQVVKRDVGRVLLELEQLLQAQIEAATRCRTSALSCRTTSETRRWSYCVTRS